MTSKDRRRRIRGDIRPARDSLTAEKWGSLFHAFLWPIEVNLSLPPRNRDQAKPCNGEIGEEEGEEGKRRGGRIEVTRRGQECRRQPAGYTIRRTNGAFENKISALRAATFE